MAEENVPADEFIEDNEVDEVVTEDQNSMQQDFDEEGEGNDDGFQGENLVDMVPDMSVQGFFEHKDSVFTVAINKSNPNMCASGGGDDLAYIWDRTNGERLHTLTGHTDSIIAIEWSFDGEYIATGGMDSQIRVWKMSTGCEFIAALETSDEVIWISWHPKGHFLAAGCNDGSVWMWSLPSGKVANVFYSHTAPCNAGAFIPPGVGKRLATVDDMGTAIVWNPASGEAEVRLTSDDQRFDPGNEETAGGWVCFTSNKEGNVLFLGGSSGKVKVVNLNSRTILASLETQTESVEKIALCPVLPIFACASVDGTVALYDSASLKFRKSLPHSEAVVSCEFIPNSPYLLTACGDCIIRKWDIRTGQLLAEISGHQEPILCMAVAPDGKQVISGSDDKTVLVFNCE